MNNRKVRDVIPECGCDTILPFLLVYIFYIILHGHLSPGGGFQGGVLVIAVIVLIYFGHGIDRLRGVISLEVNHVAEAIAAILYVLIASFGIVYGERFCENFLYQSMGQVGELYSSGTIMYMNLIVGLKVLTGVCVLGLGMFGAVYAGKEE